MKNSVTSGTKTPLTCKYVQTLDIGTSNTQSRAMTYLVVALGGAIGAGLRFWVSQFVAFPYGTMIVNIAGSFIMGLAFVGFAARFGERLPLFFMTGLLGAFTTYSAFSLDVYKLLDAGRVGLAMAYITTTLGGAILALVLGVFVMRSIMQ